MTTTSALYGMALDVLAQLYLGAGRLREAEHLWAEAVKVGRAVHGEAGDQVLVVTNSLATVISMQQVQSHPILRSSQICHNLT